ncbi:MAG: ABC-type glycerol-3-phosphate transport system substrate-binding protein [Ilumatobacter sp.]|jgi:ABC-type glycerol-3-phosphate transport system substrate-binding protein
MRNRTTIAKIVVLAAAVTLSVAACGSDSSTPADTTITTDAPADTTMTTDAPADTTITTDAPADTTMTTDAPADTTAADG